MRYVLWSMMAMAVLCPSSAIGQEPPQARPGDRIRITAPPCGLQRQEATLASLDGEALLATAPPGAEIRCPVQSVTMLEASAGTRRRGWKPVVLGLGIGTGLGFLTAGAIAGNDDSTGDDDVGVGLMAAGALIGGAGIGLIAGVVVGLTHTEDWREVEMPVQPFVVRSADGRTGLGLSVPVRR